MASLAGSLVAAATGCGHLARLPGRGANSAPPAAEPAEAPFTPAPVSAPAPVQPPASIPDPAFADAAAEAAESDEPEVIVWQPRSLLIARQVLAAEARRLGDEEREQVAYELASLEQEHGVDVLLVLALMTQESRFDPNAVGPRGSLGLMQVRPFVGEAVAGRYGIPWDGAGTLFDPVRNVAIGTRYFLELIEMFQRDDYALAAYNMGPYRLRRVLRQGPELDADYVKRVYEHYEALLERYGSAMSGWGG